MVKITDAEFTVVKGPDRPLAPPKPKPWWKRLYLRKITFMGVPLN